MSAGTGVLFITPVLPWPGQSGRALRAWGWLTQLASQHDVTVVVTAEPAQPLPEHYPAKVVVWSEAAAQRFPRCLRLLRLLFPWAALCYRPCVAHWIPGLSASAMAEVRRRVPLHTLEKLVVFRLYNHDVASQLLPYLPGLSQRVLDLDDLESGTRFSIAKACFSLRQYVPAIEYLFSGLHYAWFERQLLPQYDTIYLAAAEDTHLPHRRLAGKLFSRPNQVIAPVTVTASSLPTASTVHLLFVGTMNYQPNMAAIQFLVQQVLPLLARHLTRDWRLVLVGSHPPAEVSRWAQHPRIVFSPNAAQLDTYYQSSHIVLTPLFHGGGTKLKVIEGFSYQRPVISTAHGVRGLGAQAGQHYMQAETAEAFAEAIRYLIAEPEAATALALAGWRLYQQHYAIA